jgi:rhamnosyltransferase
MPTGQDVIAVVVTFHPDRDALAASLAALLPQVRQVVVVDNGSTPDNPAPDLRHQWLQLGRNLGVGAAQNRGIQAARAAGAGFVLLLDQDSRPAAGMVAALLAAYEAGCAQGRRVGAVGPAVVAPDGQFEGFIRFGHGRYEGVQAAGGGNAVPCDMLIASGTLIPVPVLAEVGGMDETLFIDKIDTDWSLRATAAGYTLLGAPAARLQHRLGERQLRLWFLGWRTLAQHKPFRYYYMLRNGLLLRRRPHASQAWRRADRRQLLSIVLYFGLLAPGRAGALRMMLRGVWHAWRGVSGPLR